MSIYLEKTELLNFDDIRIQTLISQKGWRTLTPYEQVLGICQLAFYVTG